MLIIRDLNDLKSFLGKEWVISSWFQITQSQIQQFADATGDHQWIHTDPEKCSKQSPFGKPIAHGHLILSLIPKFFYECVHFENAVLTINYGLNKVRFTHPVVVGSFVRARFTLKNLQEIEGGIRTFNEVIFEIKDQEKPACVAESILQVRL